MLAPKRRVRLNDLHNVEEERNLFPILDEDLTLSFKGRQAHFYRLMWKGVPDNRELRNKPKEHFERAGRDQWVRQMYSAFKELDEEAMTGTSNFEELARYVRWIDGRTETIGDGEYFGEALLNEYNRYLWTLCATEGRKRITISQRKTSLRAVLNLLGKKKLGQRCLTKTRKNSSNPTEAHGAEYVRALKELMVVYKELSRHFVAGTRPEIHPAYGDLHLTPHELRYARRTMKALQLENELSAVALLIYIGFTGSNMTPALELRRSDAVFTPDVNGGYRLSTIKRRASHQKQEHGIGFTKRAYEFMVGWLALSERIAPGSDGPLFPFSAAKGGLSEKTPYQSRPHKTVSEILQKRNFAHVHARMLRASRSSLAQRAFDDYGVTARAGNHTLKTVRKHYSEGIREKNELSISAGFRVMYDVARDRDKKEAIGEHTQIINDVYSSEEWKARKETLTSLNTLAGTRCMDPFGYRAKNSLRQLEGLGAAEDAPCIDYLKCFDCTSHAIVAEVEDIWMMLSFRDSVLESIARTSVNSAPGDDTDALLGKIDLALRSLESRAPAKYADAVSKNNEAPHPAHAGSFRSQNFVR